METDNDIMKASARAPARFAEIFERHAAGIAAFVTSRVGVDAKDDLLSETFLTAFRHRKRFDPERGSVRAWLLGIATSVIKRHRAAEVAHWRAMRAAVESGDRAATDDLGTASDRLDATAAIRELAPAIEALPGRDRDTLLLYAWGDLTYEQVATVMKVPVGTVRSRLNRVRTRLSKPPNVASPNAVSPNAVSPNAVQLGTGPLSAVPKVTMPPVAASQAIGMWETRGKNDGRVEQGA